MKTEIRIDPKTKPSLVASSGDFRPVLECARLKGDKIIVTDGKSALELEVSNIGGRSEEEVLIPPAILKQAEKCETVNKQRRNRAIEIADDGSLSVNQIKTDAKTMSEPFEGKYPDAGKIINDTFEKPVKFRVSICAARLLKMAKALHNKETSVTLEFTGENEPVRITSKFLDVPHKAIIMPTHG